MDAYNRGKESNPEFYREGSSFQYGKVLHQHQVFCDLTYRPIMSP
jgi:hypothetical protein